MLWCERETPLTVSCVPTSGPHQLVVLLGKLKEMHPWGWTFKFHGQAELPVLSLLPDYPCSVTI